MKGKKILSVNILLMILALSANLMAQTFSGGDGSEGNPWQIATVADLIELSTFPNPTSLWYTDYFIQTADIDFGEDETAVDWDGDGDSVWDAEDQLGWSPIGYRGFVFGTNYDGQGHSITNLFINRPSQTYAGFFGHVDNSAVIKNLSLINVDITGKDYVGGFAGYFRGSASAENCSVSGVVKAPSNYNYTGGFAGYIRESGTEINKCYSTANVESVGDFVGGFAGVCQTTTISNSYSIGTVTNTSGSTRTYYGSFAGWNDGSINYCYSIGAVIYTDIANQTDRGFVGTSSGTPSYTSNFFDSEASGQTAGTGATAKTTAQMKTQGTFTDWDFTNIWAINASVNSGYPYLQSNVPVPSASAPTLTTTSITAFDATSATMGGNITADGGENVTERGVVYSVTSTNANPEIDGTGVTKVQIGSGTGEFSDTITGLTEGTEYSVQAYAINSGGTSYGGVESFTTRMDPPGNALEFDGIDDYIEISSDASLNNDNFSVEFWTKFDGTQSWNALLDKGAMLDTGGDYYFVCMENEYKIIFGFGNAENEFIFDLGDDNWHHIAVTYDGTNINGYLDGTSIHSNTITYTVTDNNIFIGRRYDPIESNGDYNFQGMMDEVRIWSDSRTETEIRNNMKDDLDGDEEGLVAYYNFDQTSGTSLYDQTANGNNGTLNNMNNSDWVDSDAMIYEPTATSASSISGTEFLANWEENYTASRYYLDVSTSNDFSSFVTNFENKEIEGGTTVSHLVSGLSGETNYYYRVRAYNGITGQTSVNSNVVSVTTAEEIYYYRTAQSGNWDVTSTWQRSTTEDGIYVAVTETPTAENSVSIIITEYATVVVNIDVEIDQTTIETGATLIVASENTLTIADGEGTDLQAEGSLDINGTLNIGTATLDVNGEFDATDGSVTFIDAGTLTLGGTVTSLGTFTAGTGTVEYDGANQTLIGASYYNLSLSGSGTKTANDEFTAQSLSTSDENFNVALLGDVTITNQVDFLNTGTLTIGDDASDEFIFEGGIVARGNDSNPTSTTIQGTITSSSTSGAIIKLGNLIVAGNATLDPVGNELRLGATDITIYDGCTLTVGTGNTGIVYVDGAVDSESGGTGNLTINSNSIVPLAGNIGETNPLGTITLTNGIVQAVARNIYVGNLQINGGTFGLNPTGDWDFDNVAIESGAAMNATTGSFYVNGNWTNNGTFTHKNGNVVFDGSGTSEITGSTDFYNFTCTTAGKTLKFDSTDGEIQTITNNFTITGTEENNVVISPTLDGDQADINITNSSVQYVDVSYSNNNGNYVHVTNSIDGGYNVNWLFGGNEYISGTVYHDQGVTPVMSDVHVVLYIKYSSESEISFRTSAVGGIGAYEFFALDLSDGDKIIVYMDDNANYEGCTVTRSGDSSISNFDVYNGIVTIRSETETPVSNSIFASVDNEDTDIKYSVSNNNLTIEPDFSLNIWNETSFTPEGDVSLTSANLQIDGTLTMNDNDLFLNTAGNLDLNGTLTMTSGNINAAGNVDFAGGTFNAGSSTFTMNAASGTMNIVSGSNSFNHFVLNDDAGSAVFQIQDDLDVNGNLTITSGTLNTIALENNSINIAGNWLNYGTFVANSSTVTFDGLSVQQISSGGSPFYNVSLINDISIEDEARINGNLTFTSGLISLGDSDLTFGENSAIIGSLSNTNMIFMNGIGIVKKYFDGVGLFTFPIGKNTDEYTPLTLNFIGGTFAPSAWVGVTVVGSSHPNLGDNDNYINRYWTMSQNGIFDLIANMTLQYLDSDIVGFESRMKGAQYYNSEWIEYSEVDTENHRVTLNNVSSLSDFSARTFQTPGLWVGNTSSDWNTASNWSDETVPTLETDVTIPFEYTNAPTVSETAHCKNLTIENAAVLTLSGSSLNMYGDLSNSGTISNQNSGQLVFANNSTQSILVSTQLSDCTINNRLLVPDQITLTISAGATVKFKTGNDHDFDGGVDCGFLQIEGKLVANGESENEITFTRDGDTGNWGVIGFNGADESSSLSYCNIEYGDQIGNFEENNNFYGALCFYETNNITVSNCTISDNLSTGISCETSSPVISNNVISENLGQGVFCANSSPLISNNVISENNISGIYCSFNSAPIIQNNTIASNNSLGIFCGTSSPSIINNVIRNNSYGISCSSTSSPSITNNTITNNSTYGLYCGNSSSPTITNTIIWGNNSENADVHINDDESNPTFNYCNVEGGVDAFEISEGIYDSATLYTNNINSDPLFTNADNYDFSLTDYSPCINVGTPDTTGLNLPALDLAGNTRVYDGYWDIVDIGAYEYQNNPELNVLSFDPADEGSVIDVSSNLTITFDRNINANEGNVTIYNASNDEMFEQMSVAGGAEESKVCDFAGMELRNTTQFVYDGDTWNLNPTLWVYESIVLEREIVNTIALASGTFTLDSLSFSHYQLNGQIEIKGYNGDDEKYSISFDLDNPSTTEFRPSGWTDLTHFTILSGSGTMLMLQEFGYSIGGAESISINGSVVTINPTNDFVIGNSYYVNIDENAFVSANGGAYEGINDNTTWNIHTQTPGLWVGNTSSDWNTASNWSDETVPDVIVNVTIPTGCTNYPIIDETAQCQNITIENGGTVTIDNGYSIRITGDFILEEGGNFTNSGTLIFIGDDCHLSDNRVTKTNLGKIIVGAE